MHNGLSRPGTGIASARSSAQDLHAGWRNCASCSGSRVKKVSSRRSASFRPSGMRRRYSAALSSGTVMLPVYQAATDGVLGLLWRSCSYCRRDLFPGLSGDSCCLGRLPRVSIPLSTCPDLVRQDRPAWCAPFRSARNVGRRGMITSVVNANREATIRLVVSGPSRL
jgi:hypothetical protein